MTHLSGTFIFNNKIDEANFKIKSSSAITYFKILISPQRKQITKNRWQEAEGVDESEIVPNRHIFVSIFGR